MKKIWEELHFLVILHWTFYATNNDSTFAERTLPLLMSQPMTKRERQGSITIDYTQSQKVARQVGTRSSTTGVDHSIHVDHTCDFPPSDLAIDSGIKSDIDQSRFPDCSTHVMAVDSSRPWRYRELPTGEF